MAVPPPPSYTPLRVALADGWLRSADAARVAVQVCDALAVAGGRPHGDVRPGTIYLSPDGTHVQLTAAARAGVGDSPYVAPECRGGRSVPTVAADVFAVGVVLYEMAVGRPPAVTPGVPLVRPGQVDPVARPLDPVVARCLASSPAARYRSVADLRAALVATLPPSGRTPVYVPPPVPRAAASPWRPLLTGIAVVAAVVVSIVARVLVRLAFLAAFPPPPPVPEGPAIVVAPSRPAAEAADPLLLPPPPTFAVQQPASLPQLADQAADEHRMRPGFGFRPITPAVPVGPRMPDTPMGPRAGGVPTSGAGPGGGAVAVPHAPSHVAGVAGPLAGGTGGRPFRQADFGAGRPLLGVAYTLGDWRGKGCLGSVRPLYDRSPAVNRDPNGGAVIARDGYAVGGLQVVADDTNAVAIAVVFLAVRDGRLDPADRYTSDFVGYLDAARTPVTLGGDGRTVIGLCGRRGMNLDAVGLVTAPPG